MYKMIEKNTFMKPLLAWNIEIHHNLENTSKKTIIKPFFGQAPIDPESHHL